jgi:hypothetical protein
MNAEDFLNAPSVAPVQAGISAEDFLNSGADPITPANTNLPQTPAENPVFSQNPTLGNFGEAAWNAAKDATNEIIEPVERAGEIDKSWGNFGPNADPSIKSFNPTSLSDFLDMGLPAIGGAKGAEAMDNSLADILDAFSKPDYPTTQAGAKDIARQFYGRADAIGGQGTPQLTGKIIDASLSEAPQTEAGLAVTGESPLTDLAARLEVLRGKPLTLQAIQEMDQGMTQLISKQMQPNGTLDAAGNDLKNVQNKFRSMVYNPESGDIEGGQEGFEAYKNGVAAWHQSAKMGDIERIQQKAQYSDNPSTVIKNGTKTLLSNPKNTVGWGDDEMAALKDANERGMIGGTLNLLGSKLIPLGAGLMENQEGGHLAGAAAFGVANAGTWLARSGASAIQNKRLANVLDILGSNIPRIQQ